MKKPRIYLDHAATTPIRPEAKAAMMEAMERWANPSSPHAEGRAARAALEDARARIKAALGWDGELIFTSGASEAIEIALRGWSAFDVAASQVEHDAVLRAARGALPITVGQDGLVDRGRLGSPAYQRGTPMVFAIQSANNETGVLQDLDDLIPFARQQHPDRPLVILSDCVQTAGKLPLPGADMIAVSAHKMGGPPGIGALLVRDLALVEAIGGQEQGYRPGTQNLPAIMGFAAALEVAEPWMERATDLRRRLSRRLREAGAEMVASGVPRIPTITAYRMPGVKAAAQLIHFDMEGISVSAGSACSSGSLKPSHVLTAMGWAADEADEVVRVSFGPQTTEKEVDIFAEAWERLAARKRAA